MRYGGDAGQVSIQRLRPTVRKESGMRLYYNRAAIYKIYFLHKSGTRRQFICLKETVSLFVKI